MRPIKDVPLSEIVTFISGGTPSRRVPSYFEGDVPWITGADIDQLGKITPRFSITEEAIQSSATSIVIPGTVLLVTRTNIGKATVADRDICFSQDITALHPDAKQVDTRYRIHSGLWLIGMSGSGWARPFPAGVCTWGVGS